MLGIVQARLHLDRAHLGIELGLDRRQLGLEHAALEGIDPDLHRLAHREIGARLLRQGEVDIEIVEVGQGDDRRAGVQVLADLDLAHAELAGEGRAHQLLGDDRLGVGDSRLGHGEVALVLIHGLLGGILLVGELAVAAERDLRQRAWALKVARSACSGSSFSCTRGSPACTLAPDSNMIFTTRPLSSGEIVTWCTARTLPMPSR